MNTLIVILKTFWLISLCTGFAPEFLLIVGIMYITGYFKQFDNDEES